LNKTKYVRTMLGTPTPDKSRNYQFRNEAKTSSTSMSRRGKSRTNNIKIVIRDNFIKEKIGCLTTNDIEQIFDSKC